MKLVRRAGKACVYLIRCEGYLKIGVAGYLKGRLTSLQVGSPFQMDVVAYRMFANAKLADAAEALLHAHFKASHRRGEWFEIPDETAIEALRAISLEALTKPASVTIEWLPFHGTPGYFEEVPKESVQ